MIYLKKYVPGDVIKSIEEFGKCEFIFAYGKLYHIGWAQNWQYSLIKNMIERGRIRYAVRNVPVKRGDFIDK